MKRNPHLCGADLEDGRRCNHLVADPATSRCWQHRNVQRSDQSAAAGVLSCRMVPTADGDWYCEVHTANPAWEAAEALGAQPPCVSPDDHWLVADAAQLSKRRQVRMGKPNCPSQVFWAEYQAQSVQHNADLLSDATAATVGSFEGSWAALPHSTALVRHPQCPDDLLKRLAEEMLLPSSPDFNLYSAPPFFDGESLAQAVVRAFQNIVSHSQASEDTIDAAMERAATILSAPDINSVWQAIPRRHESVKAAWAQEAGAQ